MARRSALALALATALIAAGCGGGGGGGSGGRGPGGAPGGTAPGGGAGAGGGAGGAGTSATSQAHWQVALAAIGGSTSPGPLTLEPLAFARWNELIALNWPPARADVDAQLDAQLRAQLASVSGGTVGIVAVRRVTIDTAAPPALQGSGAGVTHGFTVDIPGAPGTWRIEVALDVGATLTTTIAGIPLRFTAAIPVDLEVADVRITQPATLDATDPTRPRLAGAGAPVVSLRLAVRSSDPLFSQIAATLTQVLDPVVRTALLAASFIAQSQVGAVLATLPQTTPGLGAPPAAPVPNAAPLAPIADAISDEIQRHHLPFDTVLPAVFDAPGHGNGTPASWFDHGDSAIWTGHYLAAEAYRHDLTGDPRALAGAARAVRGLGNCLEVAIPGDGLLGRCAIPLASPHVAAIQGHADFYTGTVNGVPYGSLDEISRDQYLGTVIGLTQGYLRVPALRAEAGPLLARIAAFLERNGWVAPRIPGPRVSAPFGQTPAAVLCVLASARLVDPGRFGPSFDRYAPLSSLLWFSAWGSALEVHDGYYKFNLLHGELLNLVSTETDPARYRDYVKTLDIGRGAIGHHDNAWFDAVYAIAVPAAAPAVGPRVKIALDRFVLRDRRGFAVSNSTDPTIAKAVYQSPLATTQLVALHPLPIERRPPNDFLWQRSPFELDGSRDPRDQYPGIDLLLPYWAARSYGLLP